MMISSNFTGPEDFELTEREQKDIIGQMGRYPNLKGGWRDSGASPKERCEGPHRGKN